MYVFNPKPRTQPYIYQKPFAKKTQNSLSQKTYRSIVPNCFSAGKGKVVCIESNKEGKEPGQFIAT